MAGLPRRYDRVGKYHDHTIDEWDQRWELISGGFTVTQPSLAGIVGVIRGDLNGEPIFMGSATDIKKAGLYTRLNQLKALDQSGNKHTSARLLRTHIQEAELYVIKVAKGAGIEKITREITRELRKKYGFGRRVPKRTARRK